LQIHLGLAAAGAAKQQKRPGAVGHLREHGALFFRQGGAWLGLHGALGILLFEAAGQLFVGQVTQLRRQGRQGHFAQGALVILCRKLHQLPPCTVQWGQPFQNTAHIANGRGGHVYRGRFMHGPDHPEDLTRPEGYPDQLPRLYGQGAAVAQQAAHRAVCRGLDCDVDPKGLAQTESLTSMNLRILMIT